MSLAGLLAIFLGNAAGGDVLVGIAEPFHDRHPHTQVHTVCPQRDVHLQRHICGVVTTVAVEVVACQLHAQHSLYPPIQHLRHREGIGPEVVR